MDNSGMNVVLMLIVLALVGGAVWYFIAQSDQETGASIELGIPSGETN